MFAQCSKGCRHRKPTVHQQISGLDSCCQYAFDHGFQIVRCFDYSFLPMPNSSRLQLDRLPLRTSYAASLPNDTLSLVTMPLKKIFNLAQNLNVTLRFSINIAMYHSSSYCLILLCFSQIHYISNSWALQTFYIIISTCYPYFRVNINESRELSYKT